MECLKASLMRKVEWQHYHIVQFNVPSNGPLMGSRRLAFLHHASTSFQQARQRCNTTRAMSPVHPLFHRHSSWRTFVAPVSLEGEPLSSSQGNHLNDATEVVNDDASGNLPEKLDSEALKAMLADSERAKLIRKLSEANQYNRFLKRQLQKNDDALANFKNELAHLELELQAVAGLAQEVANSGVQPGSRKINGKYIQSHLLSRLQAVHEKVKEQIKDVDSIEVVEVTLLWVGMAESVLLMGSFDGWSHGEDMSPEYSGDFARFSTTLKLRPGRYEIKFMVDGEWSLSPEYPTVGEGMLKNNLLIVE